jgi:hypothetical protein
VQEPQFSPFDSENLTPAERRTVRRVRARRLKAFSLSIGVSVLALFAVGCPEAADLANPEDYPVGPSGGTGGGATAGTGTGGGGSTSANACEVDCVNKIFQIDMMPCMFCHTSAGKLGDLDLQSPGYTARLKNQPAKHTGITGSTASCPTGDKLIDTANPANSWLLKKIHDEQDMCGTIMPQTGSLTPAQKTCLETYVACVAPGGAAPMGGSSSGGTSAGSGGTSSGGSGGKGGSGGTSGGSGGRGGSGGTGGRGGSGGTGGTRGGSGGTGGT